MKECRCRWRLWDLNCSCLEIGHFQGIQKPLDWGKSRIRVVDHWLEDYHTRSVCGRSRRRGHFVQTALPETSEATRPKWRRSVDAIRPGVRLLARHSLADNIRAFPFFPFSFSRATPMPIPVFPISFCPRPRAGRILFPVAPTTDSMECRYNIADAEDWREAKRLMEARVRS